jgi:hypothetical protein
MQRTLANTLLAATLPDFKLHIVLLLYKIYSSEGYKTFAKLLSIQNKMPVQ